METRHKTMVKTMENPILKFFEYKHLPDELKAISSPICDLAVKMDKELANCPEKRAGLRKLLEAKDCFVRSAI